MARTLRSLRSNAAATTPPNVRRSNRILRSSLRNDSDDSDDGSYSAPVQGGRSDRVLRSGRKRSLSQLSSRFRSPSSSLSRKRERTRKRTVRRTHHSTQRSSKFALKKMKEPKKCDGTTVGGRSATQSEGRIPPWESLPYYILVQIFTFAAHPLYDDRYWPQPSISWLLKMSRVCRSFSEPALTALYHTPPLLPSSRAYALTKLLTLPLGKKAFAYNNKIRRLEVEISQTIFLACRGHGNLDISALVLQLPQLEDLEVFHLADRPPYRETGSAKRWFYPDHLFTALKTAGIRLRSWRWNTRFFRGANRDFSYLEYIHLQPPFQGLENLVFTNYHYDLLDDNPRTTNEEYLGRAISVLTSLKSLSFECCSVVNHALLPLLPYNLSILSITNCPNLKSDVLHPFLITHGSNLKELVLNHNQNLNLSFLPDLAGACPQLEVFGMNFKYYNNIPYQNAKPGFDDLLLLHEVPTWPPMLQSIELVHLRKWDLEVADMFFCSLINAAAGLPHLRKLVLGAILKIGWRDRAHFRDDWIHKFERVFLRKVDVPNVELQPIRKRRRLTRLTELERLELSAGKDRPAHRYNPDDHVDQDSESSGIGSSDTESDKSDSDGYSDSSSENGGENEIPDIGKQLNEKGEVTQGMCSVVDIRIDNLRPTETQFVEDDFLDEEASGDEEWDGKDLIFGDQGYAW